jgi:hypothetical protein
MWNFGSRSNAIQLMNATQFYEIGTLVCGSEADGMRELAPN